MEIGAEPAPTPVRFSVPPSTLTLATLEFPLLAEYGGLPPSTPYLTVRARRQADLSSALW